MKTIYELELDLIDGPQSFKVPGPGPVAFVAQHNGPLCVWIEVFSEVAYSKSRVVWHVWRHAPGKDYAGFPPE